MYTRKDIPFNAATLSFSNTDLEAAFRVDYFEKNIRHLRLYLLLGFLLYGLFGIHDYWIIPHAVHQAWIIRFLIVCPLLLAIFAFSYLRNFQKVMQPAFFLAGFAAGAGIIAMILIASTPGIYTYYIGLLLCLIFYFRLRFLAGSVLSWSIFALYETMTIIAQETPRQILFSNTFFFLSFIVAGMFICYTLERYNRSDFLNRRTIQQRNHEISAANRALQQEISEHRQAVEEKQRLETQLFQAQKMEALGRLAGGMAHEFTNILTAVVGYANYLQMKMDKNDPLYPYAGNIITSANRAARMTNELLAFSRKKKFEPRVSNLNEIILKTDSFLPLVAGKKTRVVLKICDSPLIALVDEVMIQQMLVSLVAHARDAMPDGGILTIATDMIETSREIPCTVGIMPSGAYGRISMIDMGIGMDESSLVRVLTPIFVTKKSGLGTSMIENIVRQHHGFIDISTQFDLGGAFRFLLPLITEEKS
ncbi:MAG TPA: histidine kinase dimerization/phospho-acceptor domain-containing protein [Geobacteraceae bacterium]|nr:histidine kinase dimerization/phospho-acceptor domain-containing protein [Geobacteraceae bacterium]